MSPDSAFLRAEAESFQAEGVSLCVYVRHARGVALARPLCACRSLCACRPLCACRQILPRLPGKHNARGC